MVDGRIQFFVVCCTEDLSSWLGMASSLSWVLSIEQVKAVGFIRVRKLEGKRGNKLGQKS